jgi:hypothetical protein
MPYIRFITKADGKEYASLAESSRDGKKVTQRYLGNLGRVIDKEGGIFKSRERGFFRYTPQEGFSDAPTHFGAEGTTEQERLILDFGDSFLLNEYLGMQPFAPAFYSVLPEHSDTLFALLFYRILTDKKACCHAQEWFEGNYARTLFPKARLQSQRISEFLADLGKEEVCRRFFQHYLKCLYGDSKTAGILIDSSGVPNASKLSVTQISNHNGTVSLEARLIYVLDRKSGAPLYFRYCPGNIVDVSTLRTTLAELGQYGIEADYAIVDAGYFSEANIRELYQSHVRFITRLAPNRTLFKEAVTKHLPSLMTSKNAIRYGNRLLYMKKASVDLYGNEGFAYIGIDVDSRNQQMKRAAFEALDDGLSPKDMDSKMSRLGLFMLISSEDISKGEVLPLYYTRQQIEQVFDIGKNDADILPLRVQSEETFRGHLLLTFMATALLQRLQRDIIAKRKKKSRINPEGALMVLRNQKCKVFEKAIIPQEAVKSVNEIYSLLRIEFPTSIQRL